MVDFIAKLMMELRPLFGAIGVLVFIYIYRERWQQEMKELTESKGETWTISYVHDEASPAKIRERASELGITPATLIKRFVADYLRDAKS